MKRILYGCAFCASVFSALGETNSPCVKPDCLSIEASSQVGSGYQLYGALFNDEPYWSYSISVDFEIPDVCSVGIGSWTMNDLTTSHTDYHPRWNNETDLDIHLFKRFEIAKDIAINAYLGHVWFLFHSNEGWDSQRSFILGAELENPIVTPMLSFEYEYAYLPSLYAEGGLKRKFEISDNLSLTPAIALSAMGENFKQSFFPAPCKGFSDGFCAFFAKLKGEWAVTDILTLYAQLTYCSIIDDDIRKGIDSISSTYKKDFATAEAGIAFSF